MVKIKLAIGDHCGDIEKRLEYISSGSIFDVFPDSFMQDFTKHNTFVDFCEAIGCDITSQDDLDKLDSGYFDESISLHSEFESWEDMTETAYQRQLKKN